MWSHRPSFTFTLQCASRIIWLYDRLFRTIPAWPLVAPNLTASRHAIPSGTSVLDAVFVEPVAQSARASVLICHGIGEVATQWFPIQRLFADAGISSLVFDYSGYGRSTGRPSWTQCEQDAISAFQLLRRLAPSGSVTLLGFSLGTGVVPAIANRVEADRLVLCAGFSSFRAAARAVGIPAFLSPLVPPIWDTAASLPSCKLPVLVVHSTADGLFPVEMAHNIVSSCAGNVELLLVHGIGHNEPFYKPGLSYWGPIISWLGK
jgi:pimeloyl-ACP methyl ester carboxylesterase